MGLVEVLQDDGDVHVDDDHEVDDDERHEEDDGDEGKAAVAVGQGLVVRITVRWLGRDNLKRSQCHPEPVISVRVPFPDCTLALGQGCVPET